MAKAVVIECCTEPEYIEYWHESDGCEDELCYAVECENCHDWSTSCGTSSKDAV